MDKQIKERGIIFNGEMVRAILDGRKTQTRRVLKLQPESNQHGMRVVSESGVKSDVGKFFWSEFNATGLKSKSPLFNCPFGKVGDRLWVRETFRVHSRATDVATLAYKASERQSWTQQVARVPIELCTKQVSPEAWTPSIHMPRWASRITLEITDVRVERLNDISEKDSESEGVHSEVWDQTVVARNYLDEDAYFQFWSEDMPDYIEDMKELFRFSFRSLWESIYGQDSWQSNPWVWVISFSKVEAA